MTTIVEFRQDDENIFVNPHNTAPNQLNVISFTIIHFFRTRF